MLFLNAHISRTGGLTLAHILRQNFRDGHLDIYTQEIKNVLGVDRIKPTIGMLTPDELKFLISIKMLNVSQATGFLFLQELKF